MTCDEFRDRAFDFLQGTLRDAAAFEVHRTSCADCAGRLAGIRDNERILSAARVPTAPAELWPRIAAAIGRDRVRPFRGLRVASLLAAAAALLLAFTVTATIRNSRRAPKLDLVIVDVGAESQRTFRSLVPRYDDVDAATAMVDTMFRSDY
jgi:hypothetical protein